MFKSFVVKIGDKYCKFGSYSSCRLVDNPLKASLYSRKQDAQRRINDRWIKEHNPGMEIVELKASIVEETAIR